MTAEADVAQHPDRLSAAFEHSITWEDDLWRADPVDVPEIHAKARQKFNDLLTTITSGRGYHTPERILLFRPVQPLQGYVSARSAVEIDTCGDC